MGPGGFTKMYVGRSLCFRNVHFCCGVFFADLGLINGLVHPLNFHHLSWEDARRGRSSRRRMHVLISQAKYRASDLDRRVGLSSSWKRRGWSAPCGQPCTGAQKCARPWNVPQMLSMHCPASARSARRKKWRNSTTGWKVPSCAVDDCPSFLQPEPFSCRSWKTWALVGLKASFFCLPQAGAQLQVFDGDAAEGNSTNLATAMCLPDAANWWKAISLPGQHRVCWIQSTPKKQIPMQTRSFPGS